MAKGTDSHHTSMKFIDEEEEGNIISWSSRLEEGGMRGVAVDGLDEVEGTRSLSARGRNCWEIARLPLCCWPRVYNRRSRGNKYQAESSHQAGISTHHRIRGTSAKREVPR